MPRVFGAFGGSGLVRGRLLLAESNPRYRLNSRSWKYRYF